MPNNIFSMKYALKSVLGLTDVEVPHGDEDGPRGTPRCVGRVWKKFQMTNFYMPNNFSSMKCVLKSVPCLPDAGVPHGDGDGPQSYTQMFGGVWKKFQIINLTMPNNIYSME